MFTSARIVASLGLIAGLALTPLAAEAQNRLEKRLTVDTAVQKAEAEREIIAIVEQAYGRNAVVNTGSGLPDQIEAQIEQGATLPAAAPVAPLPEKLQGRLPRITEGAEWVGVGKHLVELGADRRIETVIYHALP